AFCENVRRCFGTFRLRKIEARCLRDYRAASTVSREVRLRLADMVPLAACEVVRPRSDDKDRTWVPEPDPFPDDTAGTSGLGELDSSRRSRPRSSRARLASERGPTRGDRRQRRAAMQVAVVSFARRGWRR